SAAEPRLKPTRASRLGSDWRHDTDLNQAYPSRKTVRGTGTTSEEVLFHCGKAVNRAKLWAPESRIGRGILPTPGQMLAAMTNQDASTAATIDAHYDHAMRNDLYG
ncbi:hypothetical protein ACW7AJ_33770, partial [Azospirillum argentinense]